MNTPSPADTVIKKDLGEVPSVERVNFHRGALVARIHEEYKSTTLGILLLVKKKRPWKFKAPVG